MRLYRSADRTRPAATVGLESRRAEAGGMDGVTGLQSGLTMRTTIIYGVVTSIVGLEVLRQVEMLDDQTSRG